MEQKEVNQVKLIQSLVEELIFKKVDTSEPLFSSKLLDSMGVVELAVSLEDTFKVSIDANDIILEHFDTILKIDSFIKKINSK